MTQTNQVLTTNQSQSRILIESTNQSRRQFRPQPRINSLSSLKRASRSRSSFVAPESVKSSRGSSTVSQPESKESIDVRALEIELEKQNEVL